MDPEIAKTLAVPASKIIHEIYGDSLKPGVQQVGKALDTVLGLGNTILLPFAWGNEEQKSRLTQILNVIVGKWKTRQKMKCAQFLQKSVSLFLEKLSYVTDEELSEMYIELLAKASQKQSANVAPS